jgi:hypothetical protein
METRVEDELLDPSDPTRVESSPAAVELDGSGELGG